MVDTLARVQGHPTDFGGATYHGWWILTLEYPLQPAAWNLDLLQRYPNQLAPLPAALLVCPPSTPQVSAPSDRNWRSYPLGPKLCPSASVWRLQVPVSSARRLPLEPSSIGKHPRYTKPGTTVKFEPHPADSCEVGFGSAVPQVTSYPNQGAYSSCLEGQQT